MTLTLAAKTLMVHMSALATEDMKEMDTLARVSMRDCSCLRNTTKEPKKDLHPASKGCLFISTQNTVNLNQSLSP